MHVQSLRDALGARIGQVLTPQLCAEIENFARVIPDQSIDVNLFKPQVLPDGYVISVEKFVSCQGEMHALHEAHWHETEGHRHGLALKPNYRGMIEFEKAGQLLQITVRHEAKLVGNLRMFITRSWHTGDMLACEDTLFLLPAHRSKSCWLALRMMRYAVASLEALRDARNERVLVIEADSKLVNNADTLMRRLFGAPVASRFHKIFEKAA